MYFNEIIILDYYSVEWKSECVGVDQLLRFKFGLRDIASFKYKYSYLGFDCSINNDFRLF